MPAIGVIYPPPEVRSILVSCLPYELRWRQQLTYASTISMCWCHGIVNLLLDKFGRLLSAWWAWCQLTASCISTIRTGTKNRLFLMRLYCNFIRSNKQARNIFNVESYVSVIASYILYRGNKRSPTLKCIWESYRARISFLNIFWSDIVDKTASFVARNGKDISLCYI